MADNLIAIPVDYRLHTSQPSSVASGSYATEPLFDTLSAAVTDTNGEAVNDTGIAIKCIALTTRPMTWRLNG